MKAKGLLLILLVLFAFSGCNSEKSSSGHEGHGADKEAVKQEVYYTCSMHPQIKEKEPGNCPICHMRLTKVVVEHDEETHKAEQAKAKAEPYWYCENYPDFHAERPMDCPLDGTPMLEGGKGPAPGDVVAKVKLRKSHLDHFKPAVFQVSPMKMTKDVRILGTIVQSEEKESDIPARFPGRIEKVYVSSAGAYVRKGDPVVKMYSPEIIAGGQEYIIARRNYIKEKSKTFRELYRQSEERLKLWGILDKQLDAWYRSGEVPRAVTVYSPVSGIVHERNAVVGKYFKEGQVLFELVDLSAVWVDMDVYEHDSGMVHMGQEVGLSFAAWPGEIWKGELDFIDPLLDPKTRTLKVRTTLNNEAGKLRPGMVGEAKLTLEAGGHPLVVPRNAIIDTGKRKVVWVQVDQDSYRAKTVRTGFESEGYVEVKAGLDENDSVVIDGNFLLDAQAQLFGGYGDFSGGAGHQH